MVLTYDLNPKEPVEGSHVPHLVTVHKGISELLELDQVCHVKEGDNIVNIEEH